jgi:EAL domain-containing protein (putative c-di-GMP-specific phosphodiesterase class I)
MTYLKHFPVDVVKVDQSFVRGLGEDSGDTAIVAAVISLAQALGLSTVGEGIETENQLDALRLLGCDHGQGFLFSKAVHADALRAMFTGRSMLLPPD